MKRQTALFKGSLVFGLICLGTFITTTVIYFRDFQSVYLYGLAGSGFLSIVFSFSLGLNYTPKPTDEEVEDNIEYAALLQLKLPKVLSIISQLVDQMISYVSAETDTGNYIFDYYSANKTNEMKTLCSEMFWDRYFPLIIDELRTRKEVQSITIKPNYNIDIILYTDFVDHPEKVKFPPNLGKILLVGDNIYANINGLFDNTDIKPDMLGITEPEIEYCQECKSGTVKDYNHPTDVYFSLENQI